MTSTVVSFPRRRSDATPYQAVPVPVGLRMLLALSTTRTNAIPVASAVALDLIEAMIAERWIVRGAENRNYKLWRGGKTLRYSPYRILVLPSDRCGLSVRHFDVFVLGEISRAIARISIDFDIAPGWRPRLTEAAAALLKMPSADALALLETIHGAADTQILLRPW